jgi:hypothetical protein
MDNNLWGAVDLQNWKQTPHIKNKIATEQDVIDGRAVFFIENCDEEHKPLNINLPSIAFQIDEESNSKELVVIVQAEKVGEDEFVGVRYIEGGNGVCRLSEVELKENLPNVNY